MYFYKSFSSLSIVLLILTSCSNTTAQKIKGKGPVTEKTYDLDEDFTGLSASQAWKVNLIHSDQSKVVIRTQENIHPYSIPEVKNGILHISFHKPGNFQNISKHEADVYYTHIDNIKASSASKVSSSELFEQKALKLNTSSAATIDLEQVKVGNTKAKASSASTIKLIGTSIDFNGSTSSAATIDAPNLRVKNADVKSSSGSTIHLEVVDNLKANASSGGKITFTGNPSVKELKQSSGGRISN